MQGIGHDLRRSLNNINPLGSNYKDINKWLAEMKNVDSSLKRLDKEISADAKLIAAWGVNEGEDLGDVCQRMSQLMEEVGLIQQAYSLRHTAYRKIIKSIKTQEMTLDENRKKKHDLEGQISRLQKASKENPIKMMELQNSLERVSSELLSQELELMQYKRATIKEAFESKFDAMLEYSQKMAMISDIGRSITHVIDTDTQVADRLRSYDGREFTAAVVNKTKEAVASWQPQLVEIPPRVEVAYTQEDLALHAAASACNTMTPPQSYINSPTKNRYSHNHSDREEADGVQHYTADASQVGYAQDSQTQQPPRSSGSTFEQPQQQPPQQSDALHAQQVNHVQEQQRLLEQEQHRLYQQSLASYSPNRSPTQHAQQPYQSTTSSGHDSRNGENPVPTGNDRTDTYPPGPAPIYETGPSNSNGGYTGGMNSSYPSHSSPYPPQTQGYGAYPPSGPPLDHAGSSQHPMPPRNYPLGFVDPRTLPAYKAEIRPGQFLPPLNITHSPILEEK